MTVNVIGAGLAGCEAAYQLSKRGVEVKLFECKPAQMSPAHKAATFAELVCSNSLKSDDISTAGGLLKAELRMLDSLLISVADEVKVPAGSALAVDRELFTRRVTQRVESLENVEIITRVADGWNDDEINIIATGPLTVGGLADAINEKLGGTLHFYDAAAPIIAGDSIELLGKTPAAQTDAAGKDGGNESSGIKNTWKPMPDIPETDDDLPF